MTTAPGEERQSATDPVRLHEAALRLFARHGVSGTSLQMIADELGVTKAAVYYRYKTKDELVLGVARPFVEQIERIVDAAETRRGHRARVEAVLTGLVGVIVDARRLYVVVTSDPSIGDLTLLQPLLHDLGRRLLAVLAGPAPDEATRISVSLFLSGLVGPLHDPACADVPDEVLRGTLLDLGRRLLLPRRASRA
ncbi:TetR/AcrR family transcriptional regulator [Kineococcus sp. SYSU DK005]|uniref:TetR/AcrR family transcriptional regulator n=1 Tax=Kineococcus sp. SYSU DK005 TaxID=3383126 RepID=UPI003D7DE5F9